MLAPSFFVRVLHLVLATLLWRGLRFPHQPSKCHPTSVSEPCPVRPHVHRLLRAAGIRCPPTSGRREVGCRGWGASSRASLARVGSAVRRLYGAGRPTPCLQGALEGAFGEAQPPHNAWQVKQKLMVTSTVASALWTQERDCCCYSNSFPTHLTRLHVNTRSPANWSLYTGGVWAARRSREGGGHCPQPEAGSRVASEHTRVCGAHSPPRRAGRWREARGRASSPRAHRLKGPRRTQQGFGETPKQGLALQESENLHTHLERAGLTSLPTSRTGNAAHGPGEGRGRRSPWSPNRTCRLHLARKAEEACTPRGRTRRPREPPLPRVRAALLTAPPPVMGACWRLSPSTRWAARLRQSLHGSEDRLQIHIRLNAP